MNKGRGHDHAGPEIASKQIDVERNSYPSHPLRHDGKERDQGGDDQDDKERGDTSAQATIVLVACGVEVADHLSRVRFI